MLALRTLVEGRGEIFGLGVGKEESERERDE